MSHVQFCRLFIGSNFCFVMINIVIVIVLVCCIVTCLHLAQDPITFSFMSVVQLSSDPMRCDLKTPVISYQNRYYKQVGKYGSMTAWCRKWEPCILKLSTGGFSHPPIHFSGVNNNHGTSRWALNSSFGFSLWLKISALIKALFLAYFSDDCMSEYYRFILRRKNVVLTYSVFFWCLYTHLVCAGGFGLKCQASH